MRWLIVLLVVLVGVGALAWSWLSLGASRDDALAELGAMAEALHAKKDHAQSEALYEQAAELALAAGLLDEHWNYRAQRGVCLKMLGRTEEAFGELLPALEFARTNGKRRMEALALGNLARCASIDRDDEAALGWQDQLAEVLAEVGEPREHVLVLEQAAMLALRLGDEQGALERIDAALARNAEAPPEDDQSGNLRRERAWILVQRGDDEGAAALWEQASVSAAGRARQAQHLARMDMHGEAAALAWEAAKLFEAEGDRRRSERDDALVLHLSELLSDGQLDACQARLAELQAAAGDSGAQLAGLNVVRARLLLHRGQPREAATLLAGVRADLDAAELESEAVGWLQAYALGRAARPGEALAVLDALPAGLAADVLRGWLWSAETPDLSLVETLAALDPARGLADAADLDRLEALVDEPLPDPAWLSLHAHLTDAERTRRAGGVDLARLLVQEGVARALLWQRAQAARRLDGRWPAHDALQLEARTLGRWVSGELPEHEAIVALLPGPRLSYLALCTSELSATTFGLPPAGALFEKARAVAEGLREGPLDVVVADSRELFETLFGARALVDLADRSLWTMIWPDGLLGVPPAMLVTQSPEPGESPAWLGEQVVVRMLPHVPGAPRGAPASSDWLALTEPAVDLSGSRLVQPWLDVHYGAAAREPREARKALKLPGTRLSGADVTASALRAASRAFVLELSVPGFGGERFGGLLLAPDPQAEWGDEALGVMPWRRVADLGLPPIAILDGTRFDPFDTRAGPNHAASALWAAGVRTLLLARWPLAGAPREQMLTDVQLGQGPMALRVALSQRGYLRAMREAGRLDLEHPRHWAAWLVYEGD